MRGGPGFFLRFGGVAGWRLAVGEAASALGAGFGISNMMGLGDGFSGWGAGAGAGTGAGAVAGCAGGAGCAAGAGSAGFAGNRLPATGNVSVAGFAFFGILNARGS